MFVAITNTPRDYAWGSSGEISALLGTEPTGAPEAELWLGAHPGSPSVIEGERRTLLDIVDGRLPFLLKVLAAGSPLSLQAHPTMEQAAEGFAREEAAGIPIDAAHRNYKDAFHKPELIYALSDEFDALCGFRSAEQIKTAAASLVEKDASGSVGGWLDRLVDDTSLRDVFEWLITRGDGVDELVERVSALADDSTPELATAKELAETYPGDPGIVISLMLNHVTLHPGEVLYLPAGNIHAYLHGLGIELMAASDNVLRGGLTPKHVDVPELLEVLDFRPLPVPYLAPEHPSPSVQIFRPDVPDFVLARVEGEGNVELTGPAILLCTAGAGTITGALGSTEIERGRSVYVSADEQSLAVSGAATVFIATTGDRALSRSAH
jgi:mannose-6-phosphate isomerase